jgi:hypothetical protein
MEREMVRDIEETNFLWDHLVRKPYEEAWAVP